MFDYSKLLGRIKEICGTQKAFADALGMSLSSLSMRLNNKQEFSSKEICRSCDILYIPFCDIPRYFFTLKVQKHEQTS